MQKMPRPAEELPVAKFSEAQKALLKESSKNISLVLAGLLDNYDHNQRPGYGGNLTRSITHTSRSLSLAPSLAYLNFSYRFHLPLSGIQMSSEMSRQCECVSLFLPHTH